MSEQYDKKQSSKLMLMGFSNRCVIIT